MEYDCGIIHVFCCRCEKKVVKRGGIIGENRIMKDSNLHVCECVRSPQQFTIHSCTPHWKSLQSRKPDKSDSRHLRFTTDY